MFQALEVSLQLVRSLRLPVHRLRRRDRALSDQMDRAHFWRIAAGSAEELRAALRVALAWGDLEEPELSGALELLDRVLAMLWRLVR